MKWSWEYDPSEQYAIGGTPPAFVAEVEKKADELVRAAEAFHLDGTQYEGPSPKGDVAHVDSGFFVYLVVPRHERVYIRQVTWL
ncbi:hypothetical protein SRB5_04620 [Streptomyces sp. RB5]|uniref:Uncharacterized protein n=1 Tax=Streptomyces smaragdinus TaxID=2585196 RepID=A0A7K0CA79_9ACTN|nr:hypothetical protein [Streptomyces smaragdinus]MQY10355.1 hypothetical protein [Streptomyces smaragdinus]